MNFVKTVATILLLIAGGIHCTDLNVVKDDSPLTNKKSNDKRTDYPKRRCQNYKSEKSNFQRVDDEVICPESGEGLFPDRSDCNMFWQCSNGIKYHMKCSPHLWFNSDLNICDYVWNHPRKQGCADARCPEGSSDLLALYGDCTKYIECSDGYAYVLSCCPHNKNANCSNCFFDDVNKRCLVKFASGTIE
ncbi:hypothetical protein WA026_018438 [Henosepilachna vigintioctopunctata]|uniref:Chitin-binding type-2 domain-containing protein n=1 Tax=Henosepilachna vigintioctopunctata TaxID=420089 RepID=A0AAW1V3U7_9CUCU